jgi:pilus assembly protein CpaE
MLAELGHGFHAVPNLSAAALTVSSDPHERVVIVGPELPVEEVAEFTQRLHSERPDVVVLLLRFHPDQATVELAAAAGIAEVVPAEEPGYLAAACARFGVHVGTDPQRHGTVITVFAAKGGCGKTTMATNVAVALSAAGARRVCLVDLDLDFGDVAISMRLTPARTLVDAVDPEFAGQFGGEQDRLDALVTSYSESLDCVLAPVEPGDAEKVPATLVTWLLAGLREQYNYVVVDTPSHFSEHVLAALDATDQFVLVTTPELPSLKNLRLTLDMFDLLGYARDERLVLFNRSDDQTGLTAQDIEAAIKTPIAAHIPSSRDVPISINRGVPLVASHPQHAVSVAIRNFVATAIVREPTRTERRLFGRRKTLGKR